MQFYNQNFRILFNPDPDKRYSGEKQLEGAKKYLKIDDPVFFHSIFTVTGHCDLRKDRTRETLCVIG
jgi:hypothetical protein